VNLLARYVIGLFITICQQRRLIIALAGSVEELDS